MTRHVDAVETTLAALDLEPMYAAAAELVRTYAAELDGAAGWRARADKLAQRAMEELGPESALYEEAQAMRAKLSERTAVEHIGKAEQSILAELLATPKARPADAGKRGPAKVSPLHSLRGGVA